MPTLSGSRGRMVMVGRRQSLRNATPLALAPATAPAVIGSVGVSSVGDDGEIDLDAIASELSQDLVDLRGDMPAGTGDAYTDRTRQDMTPNAAGFVRSKAVKQVVSQLMAAMMDSKVPDIRVKGWLDQVWQVVRLRKREIQHGGVDAPSDLPLILRAMRSEAAGNEAEARMLAEPTNPALMRAWIQRTEQEIADDQRALDAVRQRLAHLTLVAH